MRSKASSSLPQFRSPAVFKWLIWSGSPASSAAPITSSIASSSASPSLRMWVASIPPCRPATRQRATSSSLSAKQAGA